MVARAVRRAGRHIQTAGRRSWQQFAGQIKPYQQTLAEPKKKKKKKSTKVLLHVPQLHEHEH